MSLLYTFLFCVLVPLSQIVLLIICTVATYLVFDFLEDFVPCGLFYCPVVDSFSLSFSVHLKLFLGGGSSLKTYKKKKDLTVRGKAVMKIKEERNPTNPHL